MKLGLSDGLREEVSPQNKTFRVDIDRELHVQYKLALRSLVVISFWVEIGSTVCTVNKLCEKHDYFKSFKI